MDKAKRLAEIERELETLYVFSNKLKHLQLSYKQYQQAVSEIREIVESPNDDNSQDELYIVEIERMIIEILNGFYSLRECLKNKILPKNSGHKTNGKLHGEYATSESEHEKLLAKICDKYPDCKNTSKMATELRNFLIHNSLQNTKFLKITAQPKDEIPRYGFLLICEYPHLICKLNERWTACHEEFLWRYYLDDHIGMLLGNDWTLSEKQLQLVLDRLDLLDLNDLKSKLLQIPKTVNEPIIKLLPTTHYAEMVNRTIDAYLPVYKEIAFNKDYRLLSHQQASTANERGTMNFALGFAIEDIYKLHFDYYTQLHSLVHQHHLSQIKEVKKLTAELGQPQENIEMRLRKYEYAAPTKK